MTRFARAKGSKASNERVPEEATSWDEMKRQLLEKNKELEDSKKRKDALEARNANYKAFLEERDAENEENSTWAEFPGTSLSTSPVKAKKKNKKNKDSAIKRDKKTPNQVNGDDNRESDNEPPEEVSSKIEVTHPVVAKKKKIKANKPLKITLERKQKINVNDDSYQQSIKPTKKRKSSNEIEGIKKKLKKETINGNDGNDSQQVTAKSATKRKSFVKEEGIQKKINKENNTVLQKSKENPKNKQKKKVIKENLTEEDLKRIEKKKQKRIKQLEKKKKAKAEAKAELEKQKEEEGEVKCNRDTDVTKIQTETQNPPKTFDKPWNKNTFPNNLNNKAPFTNKQSKKEKNQRDKEEHARKKPLLPHKMFINGKELEIEYVEGFPVKKEDALRLKKLRREMISKGLPRSEINTALKLERRKAEKAFAREKKKVCFQCRKSGHNLSECPDFDKNEVAQTTASGICFKCGSTEHTHFECKVVRSQEFKYATCFICKEQGHIARQCPDNARGLYPKGGACKVCGDGTHLKKDCPQYQAQQQKQEENMRLETLGNSNPDVLEERDKIGETVYNKRPNKIVKF